MLKLGLYVLAGAGLLVAPAEETDLSTEAEPLSEVSEEETSSSEIETANCTVILPEVEHGEIKASILEGYAGDVCVLEAKADLFYVVDFVAVNGTNLIESENTVGKYEFVLAEGENVVSAAFEIDEELLGEFSTMVEQATNKDWTHLFSVENVITIVSFLLNGGILLAIVRYFVKDKRLEAKLEGWVRENMEKILPEQTKETVLATIKEFITPYFAKIESEFENVENALTVFSRCLALAQENTPEAKIAITQELSSLKLSDQATISSVELRLKQFMDEQQKQITEMFAKLDNIRAENSAIVEKAAKDKEETGKEAKESDKNDGEITPYE